MSTSLILSVLSYRGSPPREPLSCTFDESGGSVGRSPDNRLVLPDPERFVSRRHGSLAFRDGAYQYTDASTGGTYFVARDLLLQHDTLVLRDGELLRIGEYELAVSLVAAADGDNLLPVELDPVPEEVAPPPQRVAPAWPEPLEDSWPPPSGPIGSSAPPWVGPSFLDQPDVAPIHASFQPPEVAPVPPDFDVAELLRDLEGPPSGPSWAARWEPPEALFQGFTPEGDAQDTATLSQAEPCGAPAPEAPSAPSGAGAAAELPEGFGSAVGQALVARFLEGAGVPSGEWLKDQDWPELMQRAGALLRELVDGMIAILRARSELRSQFRVAVTTLRAHDNNPLKFTVNGDDALRLLLAGNHAGFMDPVEAVRSGFADLMNHQLALQAGIQTALTAALERFAPDRVERACGDVFLHRKARCWEAFCKAYPELVQDTIENFFGEAFAEGYERQLERLKGPTTG
ncbi:type VI secretion system-associated FHA domain protein TagH [Candidatus Methylocalor cossyra]|uniref:FHA domain protein n=1 Tax=Candidatus Methylocalor cossyra TaxID=3108543 RepID=A0ABM9NGW2_9GAMM